jgi:hypothetical protein
MSALQLMNSFENYLIIVPLQTIIDYRGYRVVVVPSLPITGNDTLIYGSRDAGQTIHSKFSTISAKIHRASQYLNLTPHYVQGFKETHPKLMCLGGDVELHYGTDGNFYLIDLARVFPPETPGIYERYHNHPSPSSAVFFRLLRPELLLFIKACDALPAVSSDSLSNWGRIDSEYHNRICNLYSEFLFLVRIPALARHLDIMADAPWSVSMEFHKFGVNMRHASLVAFLSRRGFNERWYPRRAILSEIITRCMKQDIRKVLREDHNEKQMFNKDTASILISPILEKWNRWFTSYSQALDSKATALDEILLELTDRFGKHSVTLLKDECHRIDLKQCFVQALLVCGLHVDVASPAIVLGYEPVGKVLPFIKVLEAEVCFNELKWVEGFSILSELLSRDHSSDLVRKAFNKGCLDFLQQYRLTGDDCKVDVSYIVQTASELMTSDLKSFALLCQSTSPLGEVDDALWKVVLSQLRISKMIYSLSCQVQSSLLKEKAKANFLHECLLLIERDISICQQDDNDEYLLLIAHLFSLVSSLQSWNGPRESFLRFNNISEKCKTLFASSSLQSFHEITLGAANLPQTTPFEFFLGIYETLFHFSRFKSQLKKLSSELDIFNGLVCNQVKVYPSFVWSLRSQYDAFSLMLKLVEDNEIDLAPLKSKLGDTLLNLKNLETGVDDFKNSMFELDWFEKYPQLESMLPTLVKLKNFQTIKVDNTGKLASFARFFLQSTTVREIESLSIVHLNNIQTGIMDEGVGFVVNCILSNNCQVKHLNLKKNHIGDVGASLLLNSFLANSTLKTVDLSFNDVSDASIPQFELLSGKVAVNLSRNAFSQLGIEQLLAKSQKYEVQNIEDHKEVWTAIARDPPTSPFMPTPEEYFYEGEMTEGRRHGSGSCIFYNGDKYVGQWSNGAQQGFGMHYSHSSGEVYAGNWDGEFRSGDGYIVYPNGEKKLVTWEDNDTPIFR